ncbi:hypothetical protein D3C76_1304680 [compost metagenome]
MNAIDGIDCRPACVTAGKLVRLTIENRLYHPLGTDFGADQRLPPLVDIQNGVFTNEEVQQHLQIRAPGLDRLVRRPGHGLAADACQLGIANLHQSQCFQAIGTFWSAIELACEKHTG